MCESRATPRNVPRLGARENLGESKWNVARHFGKAGHCSRGWSRKQSQKDLNGAQKVFHPWLLGTQALLLQLFQPQIFTPAQGQRSLGEGTVPGPCLKNAPHTTRTWDLSSSLGSTFLVRFCGIRWDHPVGLIESPKRALWALSPLSPLFTQCLFSFQRFKNSISSCCSYIIPLSQLGCP